MICPTCKRPIANEDPRANKDPRLKEGPRSPTLPFCSERCRAADLGSWLNESYRIPDDTDDQELVSHAPDATRSSKN